MMRNIYGCLYRYISTHPLTPAAVPHTWQPDKAAASPQPLVVLGANKGALGPQLDKTNYSEAWSILFLFNLFKNSYLLTLNNCITVSIFYSIYLNF